MNAVLAGVLSAVFASTLHSIFTAALGLGLAGQHAIHRALSDRPTPNWLLIVSGIALLLMMFGWGIALVSFVGSG